MPFLRASLLQLVWFIIQVIARAQESPTISELELTTSALAGLISIMYICWWNKSLAVRFPAFMHTKSVEGLLASDTEDLRWTFESSRFFVTSYLWDGCVSTICESTYTFCALVVIMPKEFLPPVVLRVLSEGPRSKLPPNTNDQRQPILGFTALFLGALKAFAKMVLKVLSGGLILPLIAITGDDDVKDIFVTITNKKVVSSLNENVLSTCNNNVVPDSSDIVDSTPDETVVTTISKNIVATNRKFVSVAGLVISPGEEENARLSSMIFYGESGTGSLI